DYCGHGTPFTVAGQPLTWADSNNWMSMLAATTLEARWTPQGAACVGTPRAAVPGTPASEEFPEIDGAAAIKSACKAQGVEVLACADTSLDLDGFHIVSANRKWP